MREITDGPGWLVQEIRHLLKTHVDFGEDRIRLFNITLSPFISREDVNTGTLIIFDDVTERVRLEGQLQQAEKLSSIGLFAAGLAHEVNTPLAGISSYSQMLLKELSPDDPQRELLEKIEKQSFRASEIINNLLKFARFSPSDFQELSLNSLMIDTLSLLEHQFKRNGISIELDLEPALPQTIGSGGKLQQVFMNLFLNAKDAMPDGGNLKLKTFVQDSELVVRVSDTGVGISKEEVKRIYDPFFTTKSVGKGTGLGLSVSYGIIQEHSGRISVDSKPGEGTTFSLYFPVRRVN
jgi:signal transduction histidine kinase